MIPDGNTACDRRLPLSPAAYRLKAFSYPTGFKKHEVFNVAIIQYIHRTHSGWTSPGSSYRGPFVPCGFTRRFSRSEEHTSELQSLMRISYAVFCLKKKKTRYNQTLVH